jgi:class 3 adenylate cyclase/tetratricopeptide (TPR) repeat protein
MATEPPPTRFGAPNVYTPPHLAERILTSKAALEGERKQITALFADLKGSMELFADRDPEEARKLLDPVIEHMMEGVHRYEGTVKDVLGDGIVALFGAPLAHEDHAVRACYAALRMQETIHRYAQDVLRNEGIPIRIRVGLNSGEVVVRSIGSDLRMYYSVVGQTTNVAARMEQVARPGSILISTNTLALAEGYIQVNPLGPIKVKGLEAPLEVYEVTGASRVRSRLQAAVARGLTRFVGRDSELDLLRQTLERAGSGHGQVVAVVGEAGVGKSRLYWEFTHSHRTAGWLVVESSSVSYGKATPFLPIIDLLRGYFQIEADDGPRRMREKLTGRLLSLDRMLEPWLPALLWLLDLPVEDSQWEWLDPRQRHQRALEGIMRLLLRESQVQPLLVLFEDLHWIDAETQALLDRLVESLPTARVLLLVNYRPEYQHAWSGKIYYRQLSIDPLPAESADELLAALMGTDPGLQPLKDLLIARTEGNPFFLEESVRTLVEAKALAGERGAYRLATAPQTLQIPATAQAIVAARIDRLAPEDKRLLQAAAVIGKDLPFALLQSIAELREEDLRHGLAQLQSAEFLYEARLFPDLEYTFKHALTHEVAYSSLLHDRRRTLHARIAETIEQLYPERLSEHIDRLAHHTFRGEVWDKAVNYLRQAAAKAAARSALADARTWFEQALDVLKRLPQNQARMEQGFEIRLELRPVLSQLGGGRRMLEFLREAEALAERLNDDLRRGRVSAFVSNIHSQLGELDEALTSGSRALEIAGRLENLRLRILSSSYLVQTHYVRGEYDRVIELATGNLAALPADCVYDNFGLSAPPSVWDRTWLVMSLAELGRFAEAAKHEAEAIRLAETTQHAFPVAFAHFAASALHLLEGNWSKARSLIEHWIAVLRNGNIVLMLPYAVASSAWALAQLGDESEALNRLREGEQLLEGHAAKGITGLRAWGYHALGRAGLRLGRIDEARRFADRAVESSPGHQGLMAHALHLLGDITNHPDQLDDVKCKVHYRQALALAEPRGMRPLIARCHLGLGKLFRYTDRWQEAQEHLTTAAMMCREMEMRFWLEQAEEEIGQLQ